VGLQVFRHRSQIDSITRTIKNFEAWLAQGAGSNTFD